ncbi:MAG: SDR family NAD(P)-dependent oxidoreductase [Chloroflexi bacterium]|nr:SDR family NAD(P)-dependent oxidoreductase [Chloroflexota bacterium]
MTNAGKLENYVAVITGASSGIGRATALRFAQEGASLALLSRRAPHIEQLAQDINNLGSEALAIPTDVSQATEVEAAIHQVKAHFGHIDILVNNAGINTPRRSFAEAGLSDWESVINTDLNGVYYCIHAVLPIMRAQHRGTIVNISSRAAKFPSAQPGAAYIAAKSGVVGLTYALNEEEWRNGIRACVIEPGEVDTEIMLARPVVPSQEQRASMLTSEDLAETILFVCSLPDRASIEELYIRPRVR